MQPASGYAPVAQVCAKELRTRIGLGVFLALVGYAVAPSIWPIAWFALTANALDHHRAAWAEAGSRPS